MACSSGQFFARLLEIMQEAGIMMKALFDAISYFAAIPTNPLAKTAG
jgi:hypothetical protein